MMIEMEPLDEQAEMTLDEWTSKFKDGNTQEATAQLAAKFMFAMSYYHERMKLHILLHPLFFVAGFATAYYLL